MHNIYSPNGWSNISAVHHIYYLVGVLFCIRDTYIDHLDFNQ